MILYVFLIINIILIESIFSIEDQQVYLYPNPSITITPPTTTADPNPITQLFHQAEDAIKNNQTDLAINFYESILKIDPSNQLARHEIEKATQLNPENEAYHKTREQMLLLVEKQWATPPLIHTPIKPTNTSNTEIGQKQRENITNKLNTIIIPQIDLENATIQEALDFLKQQSRELDPTKKGINIFLKYPEVTSTNSSVEKGISLQLHCIPFYVALNYIAQQKNLKVKIDQYAVSLIPLSESANTLLTKEYQLPSDFIPTKATTELGNKKQKGTSSRIPEHYCIQEYLELQGIDFSKEAVAHYVPSCNKLIVRNTQENIDLIDILVNAANKEPPNQISIETKFIEVNQDNLKELGLNWLLGAFAIGGNGLYGSGGGNTNTINTAAYPFPTETMYPVGNLRSGTDAITDNSLNNVIANGPNGTTTDRAAPGIFSIAGTFSNPQFQVVLRALHQKKGIDLMAAPHVTTKSGVQATVKIIDEFTYPTQYTPPQIPQSTTNTGGIGLQQTPPTITPAFPNAWTTKNLGVTLEAKPTIGPDGTTIDLELHPKIVDFDGFINYGTPINTVGYNFSATNMSMVPFSETLTTNTINQPVFNIREVSTTVTISDGQTVILGGLIREDIQKVTDKIPVLGNIPIAGRLFRSHSTIKTKKNLIIFVTTKILDANGQPKKLAKSK